MRVRRPRGEGPSAVVPRDLRGYCQEHDRRGRPAGPLLGAGSSRDGYDR
ncbi:hypothetical protein FM103_19445 [Corynebacterium xerosis]|nr:hypothetical protein FM103_19445 [Corynebacterium xerosis]